MLSSAGTVFYSEAIRLMGPVPVVAFANFLGGITLLFYLRIKGTLPSLAEIRSHKYQLLTLMLLRPCLGGLLFAYGLSQTEAIKVIFFTKIEPYLILFWYWLLKKERVDGSHLLLLAIHIAGAITLSTNGKFEWTVAQFGDCLIFFSMLCFSLSYMYGSETSKSFGAVHTNALSSIGSGLVLLPITFCMTPLETLHWGNPGWGYILLIVLLFQTVGLSLWYFTISLMKGWIVSALRALGPVFAAPLAFLILGETLSWLQIASAGVVIVTSIMIGRLRSAEN